MISSDASWGSSEHADAHLRHHVRLPVEFRAKDDKLLIQTRLFRAREMCLTARKSERGKTGSVKVRLSNRVAEDLRKMRGQLGVIVEAKSEHRVRTAMISIQTRAYDSLDVPLAHLFTDETLFVLVPHVLEQLVRREECLVTELPEVGEKRSAEPVVRRVRLDE